MSDVAPASTWPGRSWPLGSTWAPDATNFAVYAPEADSVWLCLFDEDGAETRHQLGEHTLGVWHSAVPRIEIGARYGYRAEGPWAPDKGLRFNPKIGRASCRERVWVSGVAGSLRPGGGSASDGGG